VTKLDYELPEGEARELMPFEAEAYFPWASWPEPQVPQSHTIPWQAPMPAEACTEVGQDGGIALPSSTRAPARSPRMIVMGIGLGLTLLGVVVLPL
jgi:hypothetical protein